MPGSPNLDQPGGERTKTLRNDTAPSFQFDHSETMSTNSRHLRKLICGGICNAGSADVQHAHLNPSADDDCKRCEKREKHYKRGAELCI